MKTSFILPADMKKLSANKTLNKIEIPFWAQVVAEAAGIFVIFAFILLSWVVLQTPYPGEQSRGGQYEASAR